jgi:hypothetical protein
MVTVGMLRFVSRFKCVWPATGMCCVSDFPYRNDIGRGHRVLA